MDNCLNGKELFDYITTKLPVSGQKFGTSLSMNRALAYLKSVKLCDEASPTWASSKRVNKDNVAAVFSGIGANTPNFNTLKAAILEGFHDKKVKNGAKKGHQVLILDEQEGPTINSGRTVDRIALLACALVDPELRSMFTAISAPIETNLRPVFLDLGAVHAALARWTNIAESVMQRRDGYSNPFKSIIVTGHGAVLADIDPAKGVFYSTASTPMGRQFKDLLTSTRKHDIAEKLKLNDSCTSLNLYFHNHLGTQNMLLDGGIHKSGFNSESTELVDAAYLRTGSLRCHK